MVPPLSCGTHYACWRLSNFYRHTKERCHFYPKIVQRGASSVYFPVVHSSLVIPPYADKLNARIEASNAFAECITIIDDEEPEDHFDTIQKRLPKWVRKIVLEIGAAESEVAKMLVRKWLDSNQEIPDATSIQYRIDEYQALSGETLPPMGRCWEIFLAKKWTLTHMVCRMLRRSP